MCSLFSEFLHGVGYGALDEGDDAMFCAACRKETHVVFHDRDDRGRRLELCPPCHQQLPAVIPPRRLHPRREVRIPEAFR